MASFFTELNRKRPPVALLDFVTFTTVAIFHAGDDRSAMEGLESLPYLAKSVESFINGKLMNEATDCTLDSGFIGIQSEGGDIEIRSISFSLLKY